VSIIVEDKMEQIKFFHPMGKEGYEFIDYIKQIEEAYKLWFEQNSNIEVIQRSFCEDSVGHPMVAVFYKTK